MKGIRFFSLFLIVFSFSSLPSAAQLEFTRHMLYPWYAASTSPADIDSDGDIDIFGMGYQDLSWYENNGYFSFFEHRVQDFWNYGMGCWAGDLDGDGDVDLAGSAWTGDEVAWWENDGGQNFTFHSFGFFDGAACVHGVDLDEDGDMDLVGAADHNNLVYWLEQDSLRHFTLQLVDSALYPRQTFTIDLDRDGDLDIVSHSGFLHLPYRPDSILWFENDGSENFTKRFVAGLNHSYDLQAADMDGDGDNDIIACSLMEDCICFYRNTGDCVTWDIIPITVSFSDPYDIELVDLDGDGDFDILCPCHWENYIVWFENDSLNDSLVFIQRNIPGRVVLPSEVDPIDMDFDGDWDFIAAGNEYYVWWFENHLYEPYGVTLELNPVSPPVIVPAGGGGFEFDAVIDNTGNETYNVNAYIDITLPGGCVYPILQRSLTVTPGFRVIRRLTQFVPATAMPGQYFYNGHLADTRVWNIYVEDSFEFMKADGDNAPTHNQSWALYGFFDDVPLDGEILWSESELNPESRILNPALSASPNPFNAEIALIFKLPAASNVKLTTYDVAGREAARLAEGFYPAGTYQVEWDAAGFSSGVYFCNLEAGGIVSTEKMVLLK